MTPDPILRSTADRLALNQFRELAQAWAPFFRTELRIAVALRDCANNWHLVFGGTGFGPEPTAPLSPDGIDPSLPTHSALRQH
jgi:hypothetical protein